ncbi:MULTISPECIES: glycerophosphodiester phosphodiesterase [Natrialbaceae]|uniref:glycerophosphodiester phosphodiesterase n=1 Tax=Natrialbaceae TaxID=1644061 RepID=UPI00207D532F|nr:glycerophosphodiester phosphodiesterase [Natronococcus sp. CG52]
MANNISEVARRRFLQGTGAAVTTTAIGSTAAASDTKEDELTNEAKPRKTNRTEGPELIAHRGFAGKYPENTTVAAKGSARDGADMIEIDVVPCADGKVVVFHDDGLSERDGGDKGLTDVGGLVWETDCESVLNAEVLNSGTTVPTLREVLEAIPASVGVNIELKNPGSSDLRFAENLHGNELATQEEIWRPFVQNTLAIADDYQNEILVSSFYKAALSTTRETDPSIPIAFLFWDDIEAGLEITREYDAEALHPPYNLVQGSPFFEDDYAGGEGPYADIDLVEVAHEEGREVNVWTIQTWYQATQLADAGVDGLIADYPDLLFRQPQ